MQLWRALGLRSGAEPEFGEYLERAGKGGPGAVAAAEGASAVAAGVMQWGGMAAPAIFAALAAATVAVSARWRSRRVAVAGISAGCACVAIAAFAGSAGWEMGLALTAAVILTAVSTAPLHPGRLLAIGAIAELLLAMRVTAESAAGYPAFAVSVAALFALAAYVSGVNYTARKSAFESSRESLRVAEALGGAQLRAQLAENAVSIGKMAAALTHELNSPMGALRSSISTLLSLMSRDDCGEKNEQLATIQEDLRRSIDDSASRIEDVMSSLQRLISLEESETRTADLNELLHDVALLHHEELQRSHIDLKLDLDRALPRLTCRPQLLAAVFSSILSNAIHAVEGNGRIWITSRRSNGDAEVTIRDNGRGMNAEQVDSIFAPRLRVEGSRVSSSNWSLFNSRQVIYQHGGEIRIDTSPGEGTAFHVTLPVA